MLDTLPLPSRPNLEQYKKQAKELLKACKTGDSEALPAWVTQWIEAHLRADPAIASVRREYTPGEIANRIRQGIDRVTRHLGVTDAPSRSACTLARAQFALAREFGFASWRRFAGHVEAFARLHSPISEFEAAVDAIVGGDLAALERLLAEHPTLVCARSTREHGSTLLHYVSANGVESFRQKTPKNIVEITRLLLTAGADVNAESDAYGGRCTTLGLAATSYHPEAAGVQLALLELLLEHGATMDAADGGSIVNACLRNGRGQAAEFMASRGARLDLEGAAGIGWLDLVKTFFGGDGHLKPPATQDQLNAGFAWACEFGRTDVVALLLERGMDANARLTRDGGETGLHWAAFYAHAEIVRLLLAHRPGVDVKDKRHKATPLEWAVHGWFGAGESKRVSYYEVIAMLSRAGAALNPRCFADVENRQPVAKKIQSDARMLAALRGQSLPP